MTAVEEKRRCAFCQRQAPQRCPLPLVFLPLLPKALTLATSSSVTSLQILVALSKRSNIKTAAISE
jgi:hypothetical protein